MILERSVGGVKFKNPVLIGGGVVKSAEDVRRYATSDVIVEWGSIETLPSRGNGGRDYYAEYSQGGELLFTQNSRGIPNPGMDYVATHAHDLIALHRDHGKPLILNVVGNSVMDTLNLLRRGIDLGFPVVVCNAACPNKGRQSILCWDPSCMEQFFDLCGVIGHTDSLVWWKISAGLPRYLLDLSRRHITESSTFSVIVCANTLPSTLNFDAEGRTTIMTEKNGLTRGGMGGPAVLPVALDHAAYIAGDLPSGKYVVGCGGIRSASDVVKYLRAGAVLTEVVSAFIEHGGSLEFILSIIHELSGMEECSGQ